MTRRVAQLTLITRMPLSRSGSKVLSSMQESYGSDKGERVFYATANKKPELGKKWHGKSRKGKGRRAPAQKALTQPGRSMSSGGRR